MYKLNSKVLNTEAYYNHLPYSSLAELALNNRCAKTALLKQPLTQIDILEANKSSLIHSHKLSIIANPNCTTELISEIAKEGSVDLKILISASNKVSVKTLCQFVHDNVEPTYLNIAHNPITPMIVLKVIAIKCKDESVLDAICQRKDLSADVVDTLIAIGNRNVIKKIAEITELNDSQITTIWRMGADFSSTIMKNPNLSLETIETLLPLTDRQGQINAGSNIATSGETLIKMIPHSSIELKRAIATNPNTPRAYLDKLANEHRGNVMHGVAMNPNADAKLLISLSKRKEEHIRQAVAEHHNTPEEALVTLGCDQSYKVRKAVALNPKTPVASLKRLAGDIKASVSSSVLKNSSMGEVSKLENYEKILKLSGYGAFDFHKVDSPKKATKIFINSKHPNEVEFLFGSEHCEALNAISALQSAYTNRKGKINRADYLTFLGTVNDRVIGKSRMGLAVDNITLKRVFSYFDRLLVVDIISQYEPDEAKDCLRMLASLVSFDDARLNQKNKLEIEGWLFHNQSKFCFHGYLTKKSKDLWVLAGSKFFQQVFSEKVTEANKLLDSGWEINLPVQSSELLQIGAAQRHCVGTKFYADRCIDGSNVIFQIVPKNEIKQGYTFQFSRTGILLQAKGFCNSHVPEQYKRDSKRIMQFFLKN